MQLQNKGLEIECCTFLTVGIAVIDSTDTSGGWHVLSSNSNVNCIGQVRLHSYTQATLHKYKVPKPVNTYTLNQKIILKLKSHWEKSWADSLKELTILEECFSIWNREAVHS